MAMIVTRELSLPGRWGLKTWGRLFSVLASAVAVFVAGDVPEVMAATHPSTQKPPRIDPRPSPPKVEHPKPPPPTNKVHPWFLEERRTDPTDQDAPIFKAQQILVVVPRDLAEPDATVLAPRFGLELEDQAVLASIGRRILLMSLGPDQDLLETQSNLEDPSRGIQAQLNYLYRPLGVRAADLATVDFAAQMLAVEQLRKISRGRGVTVALIDTPIEQHHPEFRKARIEMVAVTHGSGKAGLHGTAGASALVADSVVRGLAPDSSLLAISAVPHAETSADGMVAESFFLAKAFDMAITRGARVINVGWGSNNGKRDEVLTQLIDNAVQRGSVVVAAVGSAGPTTSGYTYPAALDNVIAVTAVDKDEQLLSGANTGPYISLAAPGVDVLAAGLNAGWVTVSGSSVASAFVSGIVALLLEKRPDLEHGQVKERLEKSAKDLGAEKGKDDRFGAGLINGVRALEQLSK